MTIKTTTSIASNKANTTGSSLPLPHLIVGAGISGVETSLAFQEYEIPHVVFERSSAPGGVWDMSNASCGSANAASQAQVDAVGFAPAGWYLDTHNNNNMHHTIDTSDKLRGVYPSVNAVQATTNERIKNGKIKIEYNRNVIEYQNNDDGSVRVIWEDTCSPGEQHVETFAGLHFRTGHLNKMKATALRLPGEETFAAGQVKTGCFNDTFPYDSTYAGKVVVILGWGSYAVECAVTALKNGAKKVHICSRSDKYHWFGYATYSAAPFYSPKVIEPDHIPAVWERLFDINEHAAKVCGVSGILQNESTCTMIDGDRHFILNAGGLINGSIDPVAIGMHYGLVEYHRGEIAQVQATSVVTTLGEEISCDLIVKCTGFKVEPGAVAGHAIHDSLFVDGQSNVTCMNATDGVGEKTVFGPNVEVTNTFLLSIYAMADFNRAVAYFLKNPDKFEAFQEMETYSRVEDADSVSYILSMYLFNKLFAFGDDHIISNFIMSMTLKQEEYDRVLDEQTFLIHDKMKWDAWSNLFAERTGKPLLEYPFIDRITAFDEDEKKSPN